MDHFIVVAGRRIATPFECLNWENAPSKVRKHTKVTPRAHRPRLFVVHTVHGLRSKALRPGGKPSTRDLTWARSHWNSKRAASTDAYVDTDGSVAWANDPATHYTWGAGQINRYAVQVELVTDSDGQLYQATLDTLGQLVVLVCGALGIQLQTPWDHETDTPYAGRIPRLDPGRAGADVVGIIGHRNVWTLDKATGRPKPTRGFGDPNSFPFEHLVRACGVEKLAFVSPDGQSEPEDRRVWRERQTRLGITSDGVPLDQTVQALKVAGYHEGLWALGHAP